MSLIDRSAGASGIDPATAAGYDAHPPRMGFFTDTSVCIGCKACEVACKEWNDVPEDGLTLTGMSYDNTRASAPTPGATSRSSSSARPLAAPGTRRNGGDGSAG